MARFLSIALLSFCYIVTAHADIYSASNALSRGDYETAVTEFTKLAEKGDANAQANLGYMYYAGEGLPQDYEKAVYWYRKAAVQGNKDAQYNLAVSYAFGEGVKQDLTEAAIWYRRAGEQNHIVSQYSLAISYSYGEGVPQDQKEAARWFKKAADQGYARAQVNLGSMYHTGEGVGQDYNEAARWYRMAADRGDATAQYNLGAMYRSGKGVEQNYAQAKRWFRQSADQGYAAAQNELASLERSAAANVATRTIQTKPGIIPTELNEPIVKEELAEVATISEPTNIEPEQKYEPTSSEPSSSTEVVTKKPLFSVDKKDLLTLDNSQLDIAKEVLEPEAATEILTEENSEDIASEITSTETVVDGVSDTASEQAEVSANAMESPQVESTQTKEDDEPSENLFTAIGNFFSSNEQSETEEIENTSTEIATNTTIAEAESIAEITEPHAVTEEVVAEADPTLLTESTRAEEVVEAETPVQKYTAETDPTLLTESTNVEEVVEAETPAQEYTAETDPTLLTESTRVEEVVEVETPAQEYTAETDPTLLTERDHPEEINEKDESSDGFFSSIGNFFSGKDKEAETAIVAQEETIETEEIVIAKMEEPAAVIDEIELTEETETNLNQYSVQAGRTALTNNDYDEALKQFKPLAEAGDSEAQSHLGSLYYVGKGVTKNLTEAFNWYKKSADQGNVDAQYSIGNMYLLGEGGLKQNNTTAAEWYSLASKQGHTAATNNLESLKKLESINRENQLKFDAETEQESKEEIVAESIESQEDISTIDETTNITDSEVPAEEEKKSGFLAWLRGDSAEDSTQEVEAVADEVISEANTVEVVELELAETNVNAYAADEAPATEPLQLLASEEIETEQRISNDSEEDAVVEDVEESNNIASLDETQTTASESPGFFDSLFGSDDIEKTNVTDNIEIESSEEIESVNVDAVETEEIVALETVTEVETPAQKYVAETDPTLLTEAENINESNDTITETEEESEGLFGFIGNIFSSDGKNEIANNGSEIPEEVAMIETETEQASVHIDELIVEEANEEVVISEIERLRRLATHGNQEAQYNLGALYYSGDSVKQDYSQASLWYRRAADQGNVDAQYSLGNMFLIGEGVTQNDNQAAHWYARAAEQGHSSAQHNLESLERMLVNNTQIELESSDSDQLFSLDDETIAEPAEVIDTSGKPEYEQALAYTFGDGVSQNDRTAFNLFYEAAEKGYVLAQYKVGVAFAYGEGVRQDQKKAAEWYLKAAEKGYTIAQRNLATMYLDGKGVEQNKVQALAWYQVVANTGNAMDLRRRDMLKSELTDIELSESQELSKQISSRLINSSL